MLPAKYPKPPLDLNFWCVTRKDLYMIHQFMVRALPGRIDVILETKAGNNKLYRNFEEFEGDIEVVLSLNDQVQKIQMIASDVHAEKRRLIWISIEFLFNIARFNIFASDRDGSFRDWVNSSYGEMQKLFELFLPSPEFQEIMKRDFYHVYPDRRKAHTPPPEGAKERASDRRSIEEVFGRRNVLYSEPDIRRYLEGVVVFDYDGNIKDRIFNELSRGPCEDPPEPKIGHRWVHERSIWLGLIGSAILLILLLISIYF